MRNIINAVLNILLIVSCMAVASMAVTSCDKSDSQQVVRVSDPIGTLEVNDTTLVADGSGYALLIARYRDAKGLFEPNAISIKDVTGTVEGDSKLFSLSTQPGIYEVIAGTLSIKVKVVSR